MLRGAPYSIIAVWGEGQKDEGRQATQKWTTDDGRWTIDNADGDFDDVYCRHFSSGSGNSTSVVGLGARRSHSLLT